MQEIIDDITLIMHHNGVNEVELTRQNDDDYYEITINSPDGEYWFEYAIQKVKIDKYGGLEFTCRNTQTDLIARFHTRYNWQAHSLQMLDDVLSEVTYVLTNNN